MKLDPRTLAAFLDGLRVEYEAGDPNALLRAVSVCFDHRCAAPEWAAEAFLRSLAKWHSFKAATLDAALGFRPATPKRTAAERRERLQAVQVLTAVQRDRKAHPGEPIGDAMFARVGIACGMSAASAKRRYYAGMRDPKLRHESPSGRILTASLLGPYIVAEPAEPVARKRPARK
jgi:hypothetical protein